MCPFRLDILLDPQAEDRAALERWPATPLVPDLETLASGWIVLWFDDGQKPAGETLRLGDTVFVFAQHLVDAALHLRGGSEQVAGFGDGPACLVLQRVHDGRVRVSYRDDASDDDNAVVTVSEVEFLATVKMAVSRYIDALVALNARLAGHPSVAALRDREASLQRSLE